MATEKVAEDIGNCVRQNIGWHQLPVHLRQVLHNSQPDYERYVFNYSLKNQLRFRGNLAANVFRHERRYYELLLEKSVNNLCLFPYHLADIVTKGLRVTPFNYYVDVLSQLLANDRSYDTLPNFTAADCLRVLGIGRNEYLSLISDLKTNTTRNLLFSLKPKPTDFLPRFPARIRIEPWWRVELGLVLEVDIRYTTPAERSLIDDLIDFGSQTAGKCDYAVVHSLYRRGLIYLDVPISGEDRFSIPPLKNFVMNRVSGDYFENLLYKIFVSADEHMSISELAQMLQVDLQAVKQAVSFFCRLGFAQIKGPTADEECTSTTATALGHHHPSWEEQAREQNAAQIIPLNYNALIMAEPGAVAGGEPAVQGSPRADKDTNSIGYLSSDGNASDFSFANMPSPMSQNAVITLESNSTEEHEVSSELDDLSSESTTKVASVKESPRQQPKQPSAAAAAAAEKKGKRVGFLFDSTLTAFLMMGNLSPGLKNHAVTMFEVGKLCEESMDTFLAELEKVSLLDAEGEGDVSRYFAHAVILRSTICSVRHLLPGGLDLLRLECLESFDRKTRDRVLEKKYKFIISATPLTATLSHTFSIPFLGQFHPSSDCSHMWTKLFYNHISGYGPPSVFLARGTVLKVLPRIFLGYGKLLVNILHSDSYVINSENFLNLNEQLKNGCVLIQGYGIRSPGALRYEAFPIDVHDPLQQPWVRHRAVQRLAKHLDLQHTCGYITFLNTGVPDIGCDTDELHVHLRQPAKSKSPVDKSNVPTTGVAAAARKQRSPDPHNAAMPRSPVQSPTAETAATRDLRTPDENYFAETPKSNSPSNVYTSDDCNELLASELANCEMATKVANKSELVSQGSVEIPLSSSHSADELSASAHTLAGGGGQGQGAGAPSGGSDAGEEDTAEEWTLLDVNFGVPLFDVDCNTRICESIVRQLCTDDNLAKLPEMSASLNETFRRFVWQCLYFEEELADDQLQPGAKQLQYPRINLTFENGRVGYWNGR